MKKLIGAGVLALSVIGSAAVAQTASPVLVVNMQQVVATSEAGKDMNKKLEAIANTMKAELTPEENAITAEIKRLEQTPAAQLQSDTFIKQRDALNDRREKQAVKKQKIAVEFQATSEDALSKYNTAIQPVVKSLMAEKSATVLLDSSMVTYYEPAVDVTSTLITKLNASTKTINVTRKTLPAQGAAAGGATLPRQPGSK